MERVEKLNKAPNLQKALVEHFIDLADSPNSKPVLEAIMAKAESVSLSGKSLIIHFQDDQEMSVSGPLDNVDTDYAAYPKSFRAVMKKYGALSFPDDGWAIHLCDSGNFEVEMLEDVDSELLEYVDDPSEILCPLTDYSDWWIYHPKEKNPQGEPALCYISHEGGDVEEGDTDNIGSVFLSLVARCLELDDDDDEDEDEDDSDEDDSDAELYAKAKEILRAHHTNFKKLKTHVRQMLIDELDIQPDDDTVSWVSCIIRSEDWKSFSEKRIRDFLHGSKDAEEWLINTVVSGEPTDKWFKPYVEMEELVEAVTLADKLTIGMRSSYYLKDSGKARQSLKDAIAELKISKFEPDGKFKFADWYLEMVNNKRYDECCDLIEVLDNIALDDVSRERVLAQALAVSMVSGHLDITKKVAELSMAIIPQRDVLPFNLACYFATAGSNEDLMYKYIQIAMTNGKSRRAFGDSDFDAHRQKPIFRGMMQGLTVEEAIAQAQTVGSISEPETLQEAVEIIAKLRAFTDAITTFFGIEYDESDNPTEVPFLDDIMEQYGEELPAQSLVDLFVISFYEMYANYQVSLDAVGEINRRGDTAAQKQIADAFMKAGEYYDAGHRAYDDTVQDQLIDEYFPDFTDEALIYLLEAYSMEYLEEEGMDDLFTVLLERNPSDDIKQRLQKCLDKLEEAEDEEDEEDEDEEDEEDEDEDE